MAVLERVSVFVEDVVGLPELNELLFEGEQRHYWRLLPMLRGESAPCLYPILVMLLVIILVLLGMAMRLALARG